MTAPRSERFEDIYFSKENGMEETRHVFLDGNNVPFCWESEEPGKKFVICETGFGTGLNFLMAQNAFEKIAKKGQVIDFISFERYPLSVSEIAQAHEIWPDFPRKNLTKLLSKYPVRVPGIHKMQISPYVSLTLFFDDVNAAMRKLNADVDCWFLDGFRPATNPEMWTGEIFEQMARLSKPGATFATYTAAGFVRRGLEAVGFEVEKVPGYGRKREMLRGRYVQNERES